MIHSNANKLTKNIFSRQSIYYFIITLLLLQIIAGTALYAPEPDNQGTPVFGAARAFALPAAGQKTGGGINGNTAEVETNGQLRDIKQLMIYEFIKDYKWPFFISILIILSLAAFIITRRLSNNNAAVPKEPSPPPVPPEIIAIAALDELKSSNLIAKKEFKVFYMRLSYIIRRYIGDSLQFNCTDLYLEEITCRLTAYGVRPSIINAFTAFESQCCSVKFAKATPEESRAFEDLETGFNFVKETKGGFK